MHVTGGTFLRFVAAGFLAVVVCVLPARGLTLGDIEIGNVPARGDVISNIPATGGGSFDVGAFLGADAYYSHSTPITGQNTISYNLEAGHVWNGHESLQHVSTFIESVDTWGDSYTDLYDRHASWAGFFLGGRQTEAGGSIKQQGIGYGTDLRSAAVATQWNGSAYALSFGISNDSYIGAYATAFGEADVINSSFGYGDAGGTVSFTVLTDALAYQNPSASLVTSAGNSGPSANTVGAPGSGYNTITVGALGSANAYDTVASFSSRGPQTFAYYNASSQVVSVAGVRAAVDISAPGQNLTAAYYGGQTGGNNPTLPGSTNSGSVASAYSSSVAGTSFAAPIVAGGAALVSSAAQTLPGLSGNAEGTHNSVVKALLLTGADKTTGWNNGQTTIGGVITTNQSLDYAVGAGRMNLANTFRTQVQGQVGVSGNATGAQGEVMELGWDLGAARIGIDNDYVIGSPLAGNSTFTATLAWNRNRGWNPDTGTLFERAQADLNLELWSLGGDDSFESLVAESVSLYNPVEHVSFQIGETGNYGLRVSYSGNTFDNTGVWGTLGNEQDYGLSWAGEAALTLYWDTDSGEWNGNATDWNTSASGNGTARGFTTLYSDVVISPSSNGTITVVDGQSANSILLSGATTSLVGGSNATLTIGGGGITLGSGAGGGATLADSLAVVLQADQTWTNNSTHQLTVGSVLSGTGDLTFDASSTGVVVATSNSTRTGDTVVADGEVRLNGSFANGTLTTVASGGVLSGAGSVGNLRLESGGTLSPGNSPGIFAVLGNATWIGGGNYNWQVHLANTDAGDQSNAGTGWDLYDISGSLTFSGLDTGANRFNLNLWSLSSIGPDVDGPVSGYDPSVGSTWLIARAGGGININGGGLATNSDYSRYFSINTAAVNGTAGWAGSLPDHGFRIVTLGSVGDLYLTTVEAAAVVPEPGQILASLLVLAAIAGRAILRRCRRGWFFPFAWAARRG
jgi:hypothetical protein